MKKHMSLQLAWEEGHFGYAFKKLGKTLLVLRSLSLLSHVFEDFRWFQPDVPIRGL